MQPYIKVNSSHFYIYLYSDMVKMFSMNFMFIGLGIRISFSAALAEWASLFPFTTQIIVRIINHDSKRCQGGIESVGYVPEAVQVAQRPGNYIDISLWGKKRIMKYIRPRSQPPSKLLDKRCEAGEVSMRQRSASGGWGCGRLRDNRWWRRWCASVPCTWGR